MNREYISDFTRKFNNVKYSPLLNQMHLKQVSNYDDRFIFRGKNLSIGPRISYSGNCQIFKSDLHYNFWLDLLNNQTILASISKNEELIFHALSENSKLQLQYEDKKTFQYKTFNKKNKNEIILSKENEEENLLSIIGIRTVWSFLRQNIETDLRFFFPRENSLEEGKINREKVYNLNVILLWKGAYSIFKEELERISLSPIKSFLHIYLWMIYRPGYLTYDTSIKITTTGKRSSKIIDLETSQGDSKIINFFNDQKLETSKIINLRFQENNLDCNSRRRIDQFKMLSKVSTEEEDYSIYALREIENNGEGQIPYIGIIQLRIAININFGYLVFPLVIFFNFQTRDFIVSFDHHVDINRLSKIKPPNLNFSWIKNQIITMM